MRLKIVADGTVTGTKVLTEAGEDITRFVSAVRFSQAGGEAPKGVIELIMPAGEAFVDCAFFHHGNEENRSPIKRIEYADGSVFEAMADEPVTREADDGA